MSETWQAGRAADVESRRLAQTRFERPLAIEAGAGTGKTATLVARVLAWCLGPGWERAREDVVEEDDARIAERVLRRVVAITFTEAAAAEMDGRIDLALAQLARGERPKGFDADAPPERVTALRAALDHLVVQTIHAWCRRLLSAFPVEAGLHPLFEVDADGEACAAAVREAVREGLGAAYAREDAAALALAGAGIGPREIETALVQLVAAGVRCDELAEDPLAPARIAALQQRLVAAHRSLLDAGAGRLGEVGATNSAARALASALGAAVSTLAEPIDSGQALAAALERLRALWDSKARRALTKWAKGDFGKAESEAFGARCDDIARAAERLAPLLAHLEKLELASLARMAEVLAPLCADAEERMRRRGAVSFEMLLSGAERLLREHPEVARRLRGEIDQLLVDEFQDTDPRQCAIVTALALEGPVEERPGLFVVGDPKQSIYGWRHADLAAYEGLLARLEAEGGVVGPLCVNYRSVPAILDEVERVVAPVMRREEGLQPEFQALVPSEALEGASGFASSEHATVEHWISAELDEDGAPRRTRAAESAELEARALAAELRVLHDEHGVPWQEFGVLFRSRGEWDVYLGALRDAGIPYAVEGDRTYYRRREILDAAGIVGSILDPNDQLALVTLLRSSAAGVPDAAWIPLWEGGLPALAARLGDDVEALAEIATLLAHTADAIREIPGVARIDGWHESAGACFESLDLLRRSFARDPADVFVELVRDTLCFELCEAARFLGAWRAANLERFFDDLARALAAPEPVADILRRIRSAVSEDESPSAEPKAPESGDAITVVTLHGAKGLDWDHVYLMQLHKQSGVGQTAGEIGRVDGHLEATFCGWPTLGFDRVAARSAAVGEAERVRTLYVGMTRARRRLVLCGSRPAPASSHAALLEARRPAAPGLEALARDAATRGGKLDAAEARWVFPARVRAAAGPPPTAHVEEPAMPRAAARVAPPLADVAARMALARGISVSALAASPAPVSPALAGGAGQGVGRVVGTAIHAALERLALDAEAEPQWSAQCARIEAEVRAEAPFAARERAVADALECWETIGKGPLFPRLFALRERILARELPILLPPAASAVGADGPPAVGYVSGAIDLLYTDEDGALVVVDYKTDRTLHGTGSEARSRYLRQGALYCGAVAEALRPATPPRFEIWWLRHGCVDCAESGTGGLLTQLRLTL